MRSSRIMSGGWRLPATWLLAPVLLAGCTASTPQVPPELIDVVANLSAAPAELDYAAQIVTRECMAKQGFQLPTVSSPEHTVPDTYLSLVGVFRSEDEARTGGYATTQSGSAATLVAFEEGLPKSVLERYNLAMSGPDDGDQAKVTTKSGMVIAESKVGCRAEGRAAVFGSVEAHLEGSALRNEASQVLGSNATGLTPADGSRYQGCMGDAGYSVNGFNAFQVAGETFGVYRRAGEPPNKQEADMAVADFRCQEQVELIPKLRANYVKQAGDWVLANETRILAWRDTVKQSLERAKKIIDG